MRSHEHLSTEIMLQLHITHLFRSNCLMMGCSYLSCPASVVAPSIPWWSNPPPHPRTFQSIPLVWLLMFQSDSYWPWEKEYLLVAALEVIRWPKSSQSVSSCFKTTQHVLEPSEPESTAKCSKTFSSCAPMSSVSVGGWMDTLWRRTLNLSGLSDLPLTCGRSFLRLLQGDKRKFLDQAASRDLAPPPDSADRLGQGQAFMPYPCPTFHRWITIQRFFLILF